MDDQERDRKLRSIGKECFVTFFGELSDFELSNEAVARYIAEDWGRDYNAALTRRVYPARKMARLAAQWRKQQAESRRLDAAIEANLARLGFGEGP